MDFTPFLRTELQLGPEKPWTLNPLGKIIQFPITMAIIWGIFRHSHMIKLGYLRLAIVFVFLSKCSWARRHPLGMYRKKRTNHRSDSWRRLWLRAVQWNLSPFSSNCVQFQWIAYSWYSCYPSETETFWIFLDLLEFVDRFGSFWIFLVHLMPAVTLRHCCVLLVSHAPTRPRTASCMSTLGAW